MCAPRQVPDFGYALVSLMPAMVADIISGFMSFAFDFDELFADKDATVSSFLDYLGAPAGGHTPGDPPPALGHPPRAAALSRPSRSTPFVYNIGGNDSVICDLAAADTDFFPDPNLAPLGTGLIVTAIGAGHRPLSALGFALRWRC